MTPAGPDLTAELTALADASAAALARLREGDEAGVLELVERRERVLRALSRCSVEAAPMVVEAALRALALDKEIVTLLERRREEVGQDIERLTRARQSLSSYGAGQPSTAIYVERLG